MSKFNISLSDIDSLFPNNFSEEQKAKAKTIFLKELSLTAHRFYCGKTMIMPKAGLYGFN